MRKLVYVRGIVQGVGFRPFVYQIAGLCNLKGRVINTPEGVEIDVEGAEDSIEIFIKKLVEDAPPLARIEVIEVTQTKEIGYADFSIGETERGGSAEALVSVDTAICKDCLTELFDPENRRYRYPFINCTNCGPRFTIIKDVPYDREFTTMNVFPMCPGCGSEYRDPSNRRFHAQPNACFDCGPRLVLRDSAGGLVEQDKPLEKAAECLRENYILAVKGLGGYHLACNANNNETVAILRQRKVREDKPFAVMVKDLDQAKQICFIDEVEAKILSSPARPIVLLKKLEMAGGQLAEQIAPGNQYLGLMLPYTPIHYLLFDLIDFPLVMTSANLSDEPIAYEDPDAFLRLGEIAEYFLTHDRVIKHRCDDSVIRIYRGEEYPIRRARGYAPSPVKLNFDTIPMLAVGGEQKNTFCLAKGRHAFVSHHIGDLENLETLSAFEKEIAMYKKLFNVEPELVAHDYHPEYLSTKFAMDLDGISKVGVWHHHAHIAACMAENGLQGHVLGVSLDGTGFGPDGSIWGGEFLYTSFKDFKRYAHLRYMPMPGGSRAIKEPWRMAAGYLHEIYGSEWRNKQGVGFLKTKNGMLLDAVGEMMEKWINCPPTSSMGRLFDAVAALMDIRANVNYEGQAAVELEQLAVLAKNKENIMYNYVNRNKENMIEIDTAEIIEGVLTDMSKHLSRDIIAYKFHNTIKDMIMRICKKGREMFGENRVCLSGGVFQNMLLLDMVYSELLENRFDVFIHRIVPPNDGNISLGQTAVAAERKRLGMI